MIYTLTKKECRTASLCKLYDNMARVMGYENPDDLQYDCTKINVSTGVQSEFFDSCKEAGHNNELISMNWVMCGPKAIIETSDLVFEPQAGFIIETPV